MKNTLLVPAVFVLSFFLSLVFLALFSGIALRYEFTVTMQGNGFFILLCFAKVLSYVLPIAVMFAVVGVYAFLMRHPVKLPIAIALFLVCLVVSVMLCIPLYYARIPAIDNAFAGYVTTPAVETSLIQFLNMPIFARTLRRDMLVLFTDFYAAYTAGYIHYLICISAFAALITSCWCACTASKWNMINLILLFLFMRFVLVFYSYLHDPALKNMLMVLRLDEAYTQYGTAIVVFAAAAALHVCGLIKELFLFSRRRKKGGRYA